jgi:hypothetical protein
LLVSAHRRQVGVSRHYSFVDQGEDRVVHGVQHQQQHIEYPMPTPEGPAQGGAEASGSRGRTVQAACVQVAQEQSAQTQLAHSS